jgi:thiamine-monophosphate kinase
VTESLSEFALIDRYFRRPSRAPGVVLGPGDDAALIAPAPGMELAISVDMLVEGRHFFAGAEPEALGHKALAVNLSDLAAMGAVPRYALLAGALPDADPAWLEAFSRGLFALADAHGVDLIGGDTTRGPRNLCITVIGEVPAGQAIRRRGALPGDDVWVSGTLGDAALALAAAADRATLVAGALAACRARLDRPQPRIALGIALRGIATAMLDVSDGLTGDLGHLLAAGGVGARIDLARIPASPALAQLRDGTGRALAQECLLAGGDDYELLFTARNVDRERVAAAGVAAGVAVTRIGKITPEPGLVVRDAAGAPLPSLPRAFDHFAAGGPGRAPPAR